MSLVASDVDAADAAEGIPSFAQRLPVTQSAIRFAQTAHGTQLRTSDEAPFILHPLEVAAMLYNAGASDEIVAAAVLHDVVEDTNTSITEILEQFGGYIAALVMSLTENREIGSLRDRKAALRAQIRRSSREAALICAADKVAKVRELRTRVGQQQDAYEPLPVELDEKLEHYEATLQMLEQFMPEQPIVRQLRFELEALTAYPPG